MTLSYLNTALRLPDIDLITIAQGGNEVVVSIAASNKRNRLVAIGASIEEALERLESKVHLKARGGEEECSTE